jgi:hypothetical protein
MLLKYRVFPDPFFFRIHGLEWNCDSEGLNRRQGGVPRADESRITAAGSSGSVLFSNPRPGVEP